ncbi:unnamed protein product, partial [Brenthis ino]
MDDAFNNLKKQNQNTVDNLIAWMKDSKIIDGVKVTEENARKLFSDVADAKNVEIAKFREAIGKLALEQKKTMEEFANTLAAEGPKFLNAVVAAVSTLKENLQKK